MVLDWTIVDWCLIGALGVLFLAQVLWYLVLLCAPARQLRRNRPQAATTDEPSDLPPVSVLICARNEAENLRTYLPAVLSQDYPQYEVIVVNDGSEDNTREVIEQLMLHAPHLRTTFVPKDARVRSTKKLALTLAAKAAQYDYLLLTDADCTPESPHWIREMVKGFAQKDGAKDICIGFGGYFEEPGHVNRLTRYDTLFNGLHYLGAALFHRPYMGVGRNLAYRKPFFFETGGFTQLMTNRAGDDDLFVNHTATAKNAAVVVKREAFTWSPAKRTFKEWWLQKKRHLSVAPAYKSSTKARLLFEPLTRGLFYAVVIVIAYLHWELVWTNILLWAALGAFLLRWLVQTLTLNISSRRMGQSGFNPISILWFDITLPLVTLCLLAAPKRKNNW